MRAALNVLLGTALVFVVSGVRAEEKKDKKEVTLKGTIVCTKCELDETKACGNAIKTQIDGKDATVYFVDTGKNESYHKKICSAPAKGSVTGVLSEKEIEFKAGKKKVTVITPAKDGVKFD